MSALLAKLPDELKGQLRQARELIEPTSRSAEEIFSTRFRDVDRLLTPSGEPGGLVRGQTVEVMGRRTSGRLSFLLAVLAAATQKGESVALVDLGDHFDPLAAEMSGVELDRMLWARPRHLKQALASVEILMQGGFPLVVLDLGLPPVPGGRGKEASWLRLARAAQDFETALLITSPYRVSGTAAQIVLELRAQRVLWQSHTRSPDSGASETARAGPDRFSRPLEDRSRPPWETDHRPSNRENHRRGARAQEARGQWTRGQGTRGQMDREGGPRAPFVEPHLLAGLEFRADLQKLRGTRPGLYARERLRIFSESLAEPLISAVTFPGRPFPLRSGDGEHRASLSIPPAMTPEIRAPGNDPEQPPQNAAVAKLEAVV